MMTATMDKDLLKTRNSSVARSFYRELRTQGFTHEQIIELSTTLLHLVTEDLQRESIPAAK